MSQHLAPRPPGAVQRTPTPASLARDAVAAAFQSPADILLPGSTAAGKAILEKARAAAAPGTAVQTIADPLGLGPKAKAAGAEGLRRAGRAFGEGAKEKIVPAAAKAGAGGAILAVLGLGLAGGILYALSRRG